MARIPFGVRRLDGVIGGGAPSGSVVLLVGESGAGGREFLYTSAAMNALAHEDDNLFDLHYGDVHADADVPSEIHYLSFTTGPEYLEREMRYTMADDIVEAAIDRIEFRDFSPEYFQLSPIPQEWYAGETQRVTDLGNSGHHDDVIEALGNYLTANTRENLVLIDSVTDLVGSASGFTDMEWSDISMLMKGLLKATHRWDALVVLLVNKEALTGPELGQLIDAASGTFLFEWESGGGSSRARTMVVQQFRGVLSRIEAENIVQFETEISDGGFDISDVRKIR